MTLPNALLAYFSVSLWDTFGSNILDKKGLAFPEKSLLKCHMLLQY
jgi:hypothetical protein